MDRRRLIAALFVLLLPGVAEAQGYTGILTVFIGPSQGGDIRDDGWTPGASIAVIESRGGIGAEIDVSHVREFDRSSFIESSITTFMVNVTGVFNERSLIRPYAVGGIGLLRARGCVLDCRVDVSNTEAGFDVGGGVFLLFSESFGARGDVRYFRYFQRHDDFPLTDSGTFDFWRLSIGGTITWPIK